MPERTPALASRNLADHAWGFEVDHIETIVKPDRSKHALAIRMSDDAFGVFPDLEASALAK